MRGYSRDMHQIELVTWWGLNGENPRHEWCVKHAGNDWNVCAHDSLDKIIYNFASEDIAILFALEFS